MHVETQFEKTYNTHSNKNKPFSSSISSSSSMLVDRASPPCVSTSSSSFKLKMSRFEWRRCVIVCETSRVSKLRHNARKNNHDNAQSKQRNKIETTETSQPILRRVAFESGAESSRPGSSWRCTRQGVDRRRHCSLSTSSCRAAASACASLRRAHESWTRVPARAACERCNGARKSTSTRHETKNAATSIPAPRPSCGPSRARRDALS